MSNQFKNLPKNSVIYALIKGDTLKFLEGTLTNVSAPRMEMAPNQFPVSKTVVDITFSLDGKTYTEAIDDLASAFVSKLLGNINIIASDKDTILQELRVTLKNSEDYVKSAETEVPKQLKRIEECKELIATLDTAYAEKKAFDLRITKLEESTALTNSMLKEILNKLNK